MTIDGWAGLMGGLVCLDGWAALTRWLVWSDLDGWAGLTRWFSSWLGWFDLSHEGLKTVVKASARG